MAAYEHRKTLLFHELPGMRGRLPSTLDGWTGETYVPVRDYAAFKRALRKSVNCDTAAAFIDGVTAAMEAGALDETNWFGAFVKLPDWRLLAADLAKLGGDWANERQRRAFEVASERARAELQGWMGPVNFSTLGGLGGYLLYNVDWVRVRPVVPRREVPAARLPASHLRLIRS